MQQLPSFSAGGETDSARSIVGLRGAGFSASGVARSIGRPTTHAAGELQPAHACHDAPRMELELFATAGLGDASYLLASGREAVLVEPQRDAWRYVAAAEARGWRILHALETHSQ